MDSKDNVTQLKPKWSGKPHQLIQDLYEDINNIEYMAVVYKPRGENEPVFVAYTDMTHSQLLFLSELLKHQARLRIFGDSQ